MDISRRETYFDPSKDKRRRQTAGSRQRPPPMQSHKISVEPTFYTHCICTYFSGDAGADASPSDPVPDPAEARAEEARSLGARCDARSLTRFSISGGFGERAFRPLPRLSGAAAGGSRFSNLCRSSSMPSLLLLACYYFTGKRAASSHL